MSCPSPGHGARFSWDKVTPGVLLALLGTAVNGVGTWCGNDDERCAVHTKDALTLGGGALLALFGFCEAITPDQMRGWKARRDQLMLLLDQSPFAVAIILIVSGIYSIYDLCRTVLHSEGGNTLPLVVYLSIRCVIYLGLGTSLFVVTYRSKERTWTSLMLHGMTTHISLNPLLETVGNVILVVYLCGLLALMVCLRVRPHLLERLSTALAQYIGWNAGGEESMRDGVFVSTVIVLLLFLRATVHTIVKSWRQPLLRNS